MNLRMVKFCEIYYNSYLNMLLYLAILLLSFTLQITSGKVVTCKATMGGNGVDFAYCSKFAVGKLKAFNTEFSVTFLED